MKNVILTSLNSKFIHSGLANYSIKSYCDQNSVPCSLTIKEFTINQNVHDILRELLELGADVYSFSCYIWNIEMVVKIATLLKQVRADVIILIGGPEVSYNPNDYGFADFVLCGEGEKSFLELCKSDFTGEKIANEIPIPMSELPFPYQDLSDLKEKIAYYESSRGCPFGCSYCLSSVSRNTKFKPLPMVFEDLKKFIDAGAKQVKFVDRTFNCDKKRSIDILNFLAENDNGFTNFHMEICADLLTDEIIDFVNSSRAGLVQFEIGIQSTNPDTKDAINRRDDFSISADNILKIDNEKVNMHLDLIAGLPYEGLCEFEKSFNDVYALRPDMLQLGFLKVLKGSSMAQMADAFGINFSPYPPFQVLSTNWLSYSEVITLQKLEEVVEKFYNSARYKTALEYMVSKSRSPFNFYMELTRYYEEKGYFSRNFGKSEGYDILFGFGKDAKLADYLRFDLARYERPKSIPNCLKRKADSHDIFIREYYSRNKNLNKTTHMEYFAGDPFSSETNIYYLFDYANREKPMKIYENVITK